MASSTTKVEGFQTLYLGFEIDHTACQRYVRFVWLFCKCMAYLQLSRDNGYWFCYPCSYVASSRSG